MKKILSFAIVISFAIALFGQTNITQTDRTDLYEPTNELKTPELSEAQKYKSASAMLYNNFCMAINFAKSEGKTVEEYGKYCGERYKSAWDNEKGFSYFAQGAIHNFTVTSEKVEIIQQTDKIVAFQAINHFKDFSNSQKTWGVSYNEFLGFLHSVYSAIGEQYKSSIQLEPAGNVVLVILESKSSPLTAKDFMAKGGVMHKLAESIGNQSLDKKAADQFRAALKLDPNLAVAYQQLGWISRRWDTSQFYEKNYLDSTIWYANKALSLDKESSGVFRLLGMTYQDKGMFEKALEVQQNALKYEDFGPSSTTYRFLGNVYFNLEKYADAVKYDLKQYDLEKKSGVQQNTLVSLANHLRQTGFYEESEKCNHLIFEQDKNLSGYNIYKVYNLLLSGNFEEAINLATTEFKRDSANLSLAYLLADANLLRNDYKESLRWLKTFETGLKRNGGKLQPNETFGFVFLKNGMKKEADYHFEESIKNMRRIIEFNRYPENNLPFLTLASIHAAKGENKAAIDNLKKNKSYNAIVMLNLKHNPMFDSMRKGPEFQKILKETESKYNDMHRQAEQILAEHGGI